MKIFSRKGVEKDMRAKSIEEGEIERMNRNIQDEIRIITDARNKRIADALANPEAAARRRRLQDRRHPGQEGRGGRSRCGVQAVAT